MNKDLHGKRYYMEFDNDEFDECYKIFVAIIDSEVLEDEDFSLQKMGDKYVIYSEAKCGSFRGPKYREWERIKALSYTLKKAERV